MTDCESPEKNKPRRLNRDGRTARKPITVANAVHFDDSGGNSPQAEIQLQSIFRAAPIGMGLLSNRVFLHVNDTMCEMVGYKRQELLGKNARMLYPSTEEYEKVGTQKYEEISRHGTGTVQCQWRRKDGNVIEILLSSTPLDLNDLSKGVTFTALDITSHKKAEDELQSIFDLSLDMVCVADIATTTFVKVNPAFQRVLGYDTQELIGASFLDLIHPEDRAATEAQVQSKLQKGHSIVNFENRYRCKDGTYRWLDWTSHPSPERGLAYAVGRDITDRKRSEEILQMSRFCLDRAPDAVFWIRKDGSFQYVNDKACESLGYRREELMALKLWDIDPDYSATRMADEWALYEPDRITSNLIESRHRCKDGHTFPVEVLVGHFRFGDRDLHTAFARDISERKSVERALRDSEARFRELAEMLPQTVFEIDADGNFTFGNRAGLEMFGYTQRELGEMGVAALFAPADRKRLLESIQKRLRNCPAESHLYEAKRKNGTTFPMLVYASPIIRKSKPVGLRGIGLDITEQRNAERAVEESKAKLESILESSPNAIAVLTLDGHIVDCNHATLEMHGLVDKQALVGCSVFDSVTESDMARARATLETTRANGLIRNVALEFLRKDGRTFPCEISASIMNDPDGQPKGLVMAMADITERRQTEEALAHSAHLLAESQKVARIGHYSLDIPNDRWTSSEMLDAIFGISQQDYERTTQGWLGLVHPEDRREMENYLAGVISGAQRHFDKEYRIIRQTDHETRWVHGLGRIVRDEHGAPESMIGVIQDVTERKEAEQERLAYESKLRSLASELALAEERERRRIAANLHDHACQSLALSKMKIQSLLSTSNPEQIKTLQSVCDTLTETIENVRELTFDLSSPTLYKIGLAAALEELLRDKLKQEHNIMYRFSDDGKPKPLSQDVLVLLFQCVRELLINVIKHAKAREVTLDMYCSDRSIRIVVSDDGVGFDAKEIWVPSPDRRSVGLFNIRERLDHIGGRLVTDSHPGRGSRFVLEAPLKVNVRVAKESDHGTENLAR